MKQHINFYLINEKVQAERILNILILLMNTQRKTTPKMNHF